MADRWWFQHEGETVVWEGRPRRSAALGGVMGGVLLTVLALVAAAIVDPRLAVGGLFGLGLSGWQLLRVHNTRYLLTSRALWAKRGVVGCTVRRVGLPQVQNTAYSQSITGGVVGYGTVTVEVAGGADLAFRRIDDPEAVRRLITQQTAGASTEIPGTIAQWRAVRSLVRDISAAVE